MGVGKGFWDVLKPVARMESLDSLRGKVLAIDLSFWMIQLLSRVKSIPLRKPHIRLLFFRTIHLVAKIGAFPVFVADGEPPPLKLQVRLNRFNRISGVPLNTFLGDSNCNLARNNLFTDNVDECVKLLELLGMPVLRAKHEAEALCAELQRQGLVNACVTPDSDAFLYGAKHVIKILQADLKDPHVESYMMGDIESFLGLHREHLVALALLAGCDYNVTGVPGIGCQNAVRVIKAVPKHRIFDKLRDWGTGRFESEPENRDFDGCGKEGEALTFRESGGWKKVPHCSSCGHPGTKKLHTKLGCEECTSNDGSANHIDQQGCRPKVQGFKCTCEYCTRKEALKKHAKHEGWKIKVCQKMFETRGFPNEEIIEIFMNPEQDTLSGDVKPSLAWKSPLLEALEEFLEDHLHWEKAYVRRKLLPLLSFYCLKDTAAIRSLDRLTSIAPSINGIYVPHSIQRIKILFSKPLYRLRWSQSTLAKTQEDWLGLKCLPSNEDKKIDDGLDIMVSDLQTENLNNNLLFTTDEDMMLVKDAYPKLVAQFEKEQDARKSKKKGRKIVVDNLSRNQLRITSFFPSRKGGTCSYDAKEIPERAVEGSTLELKTQVVLTKALDIEENGEPQIGEAAVPTAEKQGRSACDTTRATQVGIIRKDGGRKDPSKEDVSECRIDSIDVGVKADGENLIKETKRMGACYKQEVILIEDEETAEVYPCKANKTGNDSPGSQTSRERFSSFSKTTTQDGPRDIIDVDTTPPLMCWRELYKGNTTKASDLTNPRSPKATPRRVLFS